MTPAEIHSFVEAQQVKYEAILQPTKKVESDVTAGWLARQIQDCLHRVLQDFVGYFGGGQCVLGEFLQGVIPKRVFSGLESAANYAERLAELGDGSLSGLAAKIRSGLANTPEPVDVANWIAEYQAHLSNEPTAENPTLDTVDFSDLKPYRYQEHRLPKRYEDAFSAIESIADNLQTSFDAPLLVHGSFASEDAISGWSDVDTVLLLPTACSTDPTALLAVRAQCRDVFHQILRIDPLQIHGIFVTAEPEWARYSKVYFPPFLFQHCRPFRQLGQTIDFHCRTETTSASALLWSSCYWQFMYPAIKQKRAPGARAMKNFLHAIFSVPILYLQVRNQGVYKRDAFPIVEQAFAEHWEPVRQATALMRRFSVPATLIAQRHADKKDLPSFLKWIDASYKFRCTQRKEFSAIRRAYGQMTNEMSELFMHIWLRLETDGLLNASA